MQLPVALERLASQLGRLPGIGERTALRLAFHVLASERSHARALAQVLSEVHDAVGFCQQCHHLAGGDLCEICADRRRDPTMVCVVEGVPDLLAIERTGEYGGLYHVLQGVLSPLRGVGPSELTIAHLVARVRAPAEPDQAIREVILATPVSIEGEATASYIQSLLEGAGSQLTRIASGVPQGTELEYIDQATLGRALRGRTTL